MYKSKESPISAILQQVTVDCKDNGKKFINTKRIEVIKELLAHSEYKLLHEGNLCLIYGKQNVDFKSVVLVSSHIDCVFDELFCKDFSSEYYQGTFDNSLTNACVLYDMITNSLPDDVVVAFTGDEEEDSGGAYEVMRTFKKWRSNIKLAIVLDVTEEGWTKEHPFTIENDLGIDLFTGHKIIETVKPFEGSYTFVHDAEPDESWDYDEEDIPCFTLCIPIKGDMHSDDGVLTRKSSLPIYSKVLSLLAEAIHS